MHNLILPLTLDFWLKVGLTFLCGGVIGLERQLRGKAAGIRTSILICMGTQTFVSLSVVINSGTTGYDPSRVLGQVVTGIGFIGAGVIMGKGGEVKGVTSAAIIWMLAAIGSAIGFGYLTMAATLTLMTVGVLIGVEMLEETYIRLRRGDHKPSREEVESDEE
ncbi:MAG: MgtC/SapB family protein [Desulfobulbaceae bacterium]|nr:MgtC/SapB family protein [Desulfobulbaceae bacterium]